MPMNWTPDNDRILLLKLIETHSISVNYDKIVEAWPKDAPIKPTERAIRERFVKLRKLTGIPASGGSKSSTPATVRTKALGGATKGFKTPTSSAKKRKTKNPSEDSDDGEEHLTPSEDDTPTHKSRKMAQGRTPASTVRSGAGLSGMSRGPTNAFNSFNDADDENSNASNSFNKSAGLFQNRIKAEPVDDPFHNGDFARTLANAANMNRMNIRYNSPMPLSDYGVPGNDMPSFAPGVGSSQYATPSASFDSAIGPAGMDGGNDHMMYGSFNTSTAHIGAGMAMDGGMGQHNLNMGMNTTMPGAYLASPLVNSTSNLRISPQPHSTFINKTPNNMKTGKPAQGVPAPSPSSRLSMAPSEASASGTPRARSARKASERASEGMSAYIKVLKEKEDDERSSVEDSAASEFQGSDDEYV